MDFWDYKEALEPGFPNSAPSQMNILVHGSLLEGKLRLKTGPCWPDPGCAVRILLASDKPEYAATSGKFKWGLKWSGNAHFGNFSYFTPGMMVPVKPGFPWH